MDVTRMLKELRDERDLIDESIAALTPLDKKKRRGRPPLWLVEATQMVKRRGRPPGSKNKRKAVAAESMPPKMAVA